jgi:cysteinyl-tRNA synthetase
MLIWVLPLILIFGCSRKEEAINYRQEMREFVKKIAYYARSLNPRFIIIPQNGPEIIKNEDGEIAWDYVSAIDGAGREELLYGYEGFDVPTPDSITNYWREYLDILKENRKKVLVIDYCTTKAYVDSSYSKNERFGYISFAADRREVSSIPPYPSQPYNVNSRNITDLWDAKNFLYILNPSGFTSKEEFLNALRNTDYDVLIIDMFYNGEALRRDEVSSLKVKRNGGRRLVIAYMSIGEAEDYRYYWKEEWKNDPPEWLGEENPEWPGNYKVKYWYKEWQDIILGYTRRIVDAGFDGAYLDIIDAFEYWENREEN